MTAQELKNSILQLAVQGKLVEQRPEEGTAKELLAQIKDEKEQLIKDKKIKKEKPLPEIIDEEKPFDIPESWEWVRLSEVVEMVMGQSSKGTDVMEGGDGIEFHQGKVYFGSDYLDISPQTTIKPTKIVEPDTVLLCVRAPVGTANITNRKICIGRGLCGLIGYGNIESRFILNWIRAFKNDFIRKATGTTFIAITGEVVREQVIPLPPLAEQKRIVSKIEEILPYIEQYDKAYTELEAFNKKFPEDMKKSVLQLAMQGKLVEQRPEEGTAKELLAGIKAEKEQLIKDKKIKKEKPLPEITDEEKPFDIPDSWEWVRLGEIGELQTGTTPSKAHPEYFGFDMPFLSPGDIYNGTITYREEGLSKLGIDVARIIKENSVVQVCIGGSIGKAAINDRKIAFNQQINSITPYLINHKYMYYVMTSDYFLKVMKKYATGTATPIINKSTWGNIIISLPPLEEQKRIVSKIEEILPYCEQLVK